jgi:hypothetical protein
MFSTSITLLVFVAVISPATRWQIHLAVGGTWPVLEGVTSQATSPPEPQNKPRSNRKLYGLNCARQLLQLNWTMNGTELVHIKTHPHSINASWCAKCLRSPRDGSGPKQGCC